MTSPLFNSPLFSKNSDPVKEFRSNEKIPEIPPKIVHEERVQLAKKIKTEFEKNDDALHKNSVLLNQSIESLLEVFQKDIDPSKALALTNLSFSAKQTDFEGWPDTEANLFFLHISKTIQSNKGIFSKNIPDSIIETFQELTLLDQQSFRNKVEFCVKRLQELKPDQSFTINSGWSAVPHGHSMLIRFERQEENKFHIYIYDTSASNGYEKKAHHFRTKPYIKLENVKWQELFFCHPGEKVNPIVLKNVFELLIAEKVPKNPGPLLVLGCFAHLMHRLVSSKRLPSLFLSLQIKSGNCAIKSRSCLSLDLFKSSSLYKLFSLDLRLLTLIAFYHTFKNKFSDHDLKLFQLKDATTNFLRVLRDNFIRSSLIEEKSYITAVATARHILKEIEELERSFEAKLKNPVEMPEAGVLSKAESILCKERHDFTLNLPLLLAPSLVKVKHETPHLNSNLGLNIEWKDFCSTLSSLRKLVWGRKEEEVLYQVQAAMLNMSHLKEKDPEFSTVDARSAQIELSYLQGIYHNSLFRSDPTLSPEIQNSIMEFLALAYQLAKAADKPYKVLQNYGLHCDFFINFAENDRLFAIQDPASLKQRNGLVNFFKTHRRESRIFNFENEHWDSHKFENGLMPDGKMAIEYIGCDETIKKLFINLAEQHKQGSPKAAIEGAFRCYFSENRIIHNLLAHVFQLKIMLVNALEACNIGYARSLEKDKELENYFGARICTSQVCWTTDLRGQNPDFFKASFKDFSPNQELDFFVRDDLSVKKSSLIPSENITLISEDENVNLPFLLALSQPEVQTTVLLTALEENLDRLHDSTFRLFLGHIFLRTVLKGGDLYSPFIDSLSDPQYIHKFEKLILIGKKTFIDSMPESRPGIDEMLFLARLYARALHILTASGNYPLSKETQDIYYALATILTNFLKLPGLSQDHKKEIQIAKFGLLLAIPYEQLLFNYHAELFLSFVYLNNLLHPKSPLSDPSFYRLCKQKYYRIAWQDLFNETNPDFRNDFANSVLNQTLNTNQQLKWMSDFPQLIAKDAQDEKWTIDLQEGFIANSQGRLTPKPLAVISTTSFKRLFKNTQYEFKVFGEETRFEDPIWGSIRIIGMDDNASIHREMEGKWHTYIPFTRRMKSSLFVSSALFDDHTLWVNPEDPQKIRFFDFTGKEQYRLENGQIKDLKTNKQFAYIAPQGVPFFERFETAAHINLWFETPSKKEVEGSQILEMSRFQSEDNNPLSFRWNENKKNWVYSENPEFQADAGPELNFPFNTNYYLPLINSSRTKRKILIPQGKIFSKGYKKIAKIETKELDTENQKRTLTYFEYDVLFDGQLIGKSFEAKIYLAHLWLAQKEYQRALEILTTFSLNETLTERAIELSEDLLNSAEKIHDFSPNSCAIRLRLFLLLKKINPFISFKENEGTHQSIFENYKIYLYSLNNIEEPLEIDSERELNLIEYLEGQKIDESLSTLSGRRSQLKELQSPMVTIGVSEPCHSFEVLKPMLIQFDPYNVLKDEDSFLGDFKVFSDFYNRLKESSSIAAPETQGILYELLMAKQRCEVHQARWAILLFAAHHPNECLPLPNMLDSKDCNTWSDSTKISFEKTSNTQTNVDPLKFVAEYPLVIPSTLESSKSIAASPSAPSKKVLELTPQLVRVDQDTQFREWQKQYLEIPKLEKDLLSSKTEKTVSFELKEAEKYQKAIEKRAAYYQTECIEASKLAQQKLFFKKEADYEKLLISLTEENNRSKIHTQNLQKFIEEIANRKPSSFPLFVHQQATSLGQVLPKIKLEKLLRASVQSNSLEALKKLNSSLSEDEALQLHSACIEFMIEETHCHHLQKIMTPLDRWFKSGKKDHSSYELVQDAMRDDRNYDPKTRPFVLLFEYFSGLRVKFKQASIINLVVSAVLEAKDEELQNKVFQLIMGGGKTSVIISMLLELISESGQLACMMCHHSQLASVQGNLAEFQSKRFEKQVCVLDYAIADLDKLSVLENLYKRIQEAQRKKWPLIMKTSLPQIIELKLFLESLRLPNMTPEGRGHLKEIIHKLQDIHQIFSEMGVSIYDESDISLSILTDVIIPLGKPKSVNPEKAEVIRPIFEALIEKEMDQLVGLSANLQSELSSSDFEDKVLPFICDKIFHARSFKLASKHSSLKKAFGRFVCDKIPVADQKAADDLNTDLNKLSQERRENVLFLRILAEYHAANDIYEKEASQRISEAKLSLKILRHSIFRSNNRNYGRNPAQKDGSISPFLAVGTPSTTKFANILLTLAYHFQTSSNEKTESGVIFFLAKKMKEAATHYAIKEKKPFSETLEAQQFYDLTKVKLEDITKPGKIEKAVAYVNATLERRLAFEVEVAPFHVHYYEQRIESNSINNVSQFRKSVACSGTPWNHSTWHRRFGKPALDTGTEGSILNVLEEKSQDPKTSIRDLEVVDLDSIFTLIKTHPNKSKIRAFTDGGGLLKAYSNEQAAASFLSFFENEKANGGPDIGGVLYLHKYSAQEISEGAPKERYVILRAGETKPIRLKNTTAQEIEKYGVKSDRLFVLFDELRATGTDIDLADDAIFLNTIDHKIPTRTALQASFRARKLFREQRIEFIMSTKARKEMINQGINFDHLRATWEKNEGIQLEDHTARSRPKQIQDVIRCRISKEIARERNMEKLSALSETYRDFLITIDKKDAYSQCGRILGTKPLYDFLNDYAHELLEKFRKTGSPSFEEAEKDMQKLLKKYREEISDDETIDLSTGEELDATLEMEELQELSLELEQTDQFELNNELQHELDQFIFYASSYHFSEKRWALSQKLPLWDQIKPSLVLIHDDLKTIYKNNASTKAYAPCFPNYIWMTHNFKQTLYEDLPVFHPLRKLVSFVLAVQKGKNEYEFVLISENDAVAFKNWLKERPSEMEAYLLDISGSPEINLLAYEKSSPEAKEALLTGVWYANFYNGNIDFLESHADLTRLLTGSCEVLAKKYIQLQSARNPKNLQKLASCKVFEFSEIDTLKKPQFNGLLFSYRRKYIEEKYNELRLKGPEEIAQLDPELVENIAPRQVPWLKTKEQILKVPDSLIDYLIPRQIHHLAPSQVPFIKKVELIQALISKEQTEKLSDKQLENIDHSQILLLSDQQLAKIPFKTIAKITCPIEIRRLKGNRVKGLLEAQLPFMDPKEVNFLTDIQIPWLATKELIIQLLPNKSLFLKTENRVHLEDPMALFLLPDSINLKEKQLELVKEWLKKNPFDEKPLRPWHIPLLAEEHFSSLTESQLIRCIPVAFAHKITAMQAAHLTFQEAEVIQALDYPAFMSIRPSLRFVLVEKQFRCLKKIDQLFIECLSATHAAFLGDEELQYISPLTVKYLLETEIKRLKNPSLLLELKEESAQKLTPDQITILKDSILKIVDPNTLKPWHVPFLPVDRIPELSNPELIRAIPVEAAAHITRKQASHLNLEENQSLIPKLKYPEFLSIADNLVPFLVEEQLKQLDIHDGHCLFIIERLTLSQVILLDDEAFQWINIKLVNCLDAKDIKRLAEIERLLALNHEKFALLEKAQKDHVRECLKTHCLDELRPWHLPFVPLQRFPKITDPELIKHFTQENAPFIIEDQAPHLTLAQSSLVPLLDHPVFLYINEELYPFLNANQIEKLRFNQPLDLWMIARLTAAQASSLNNNALQYISRSIVNDLGPEDIKRISSLNLLLELNEENQEHLFDGQKEAISIHISRINTEEQVQNLPDRHLGFLPFEKVHLVSMMRFSKLKTEQLEYLSENQVRALTEREFILRLPNSKISLLLANQVSSLHLEDFTDEILHNLGKKGLKAINKLSHKDLPPRLTKDQVRALKPKHLAIIRHLEKEQLPDLSNQALQKIGSDQVNALEAADLNRLSDSLLLDIDETHVPDLESQKLEQLHTLVNNLSNPSKLKSHHLPMIHTQAPVLPLIEDGDQLADLPERLYPYLSDTQYFILDSMELTADQVAKIPISKLHKISTSPANVALINSDQISQMTPEHRELIEKLSGEQLFMLPKELISHLSDEQYFILDSMELTAEQVAKIPVDKLHKITSNPANAALINSDQISQITTDHQDLIAKLNGEQLLALQEDLFACLSVDQILLVNDLELTAEQVRKIPVNKLKHIGSNPANVALIGPEQISQLILVHADLVDKLSPDAIASCDRFPPSLIEHLTDDQLTHLAPTRNNIEAVDRNRWPKLTDAQLRIFYNTKEKRAGYILGGLAYLWVIPVLLPAQFLLNLFQCLAFVIGTIFKSSLKGKLNKQIKNTFINGPARTVAPALMISDYIKYKRMYWKFGGINRVF